MTPKVINTRKHLNKFLFTFLKATEDDGPSLEPPRIFYEAVGLVHPEVRRCTKFTTSQKIPGVLRLGSTSSMVFKMVGRNLFGCSLKFMASDVQPPFNNQIHQAYKFTKNSWCLKT